MPPPRKTPAPSPKPAATAAPTAAPAAAAAPARSEVKGSGSPKMPAVSAPRQVSYEQIAQRAYEIYVRKGRHPGHELEDWLEAEEELRQEATSAIATWDPYFGYLAQLLELAEGQCEAIAVEEEESPTLVALVTAG